MSLRAGDLAVDYSAARPDLADLKKSGVRAIIRYSSGTHAASASGFEKAKLCQPGEVRAAEQAGVDLIAVSEGASKARMLDGRDAGVADGAADLTFWQARGYAKGAIIFCAYDTAQPDPHAHPAVSAYLEGYRESIDGYYEVGMYGGDVAINAMLDAGVIHFGWRSMSDAWSRNGSWYRPDDPGASARLAHVSNAHLWQTGNLTCPSVDEDVVLRDGLPTHLSQGGAPPAKPAEPESGDPMTVVDVLRAAGLTVVEMPGWHGRHRFLSRFRPKAVMWHHDAMALGWNSDPDDDLNVPKYMARPGKLGSQFWVGRDGTWVVVADGRMPHAGRGPGRRGIRRNKGNLETYGIETDHTVGTPWPDRQVASIIVGSAALCAHFGFDPNDCLGHKEYAPGRKIDPSGADMNDWRGRTAAAMTGVPPVRPAGGTYVVKPGNTLSSIGRRTGVEWRRIAQVNGIEPPYIIHPGDTLTIPGAKHESSAILPYRDPPAWGVPRGDYYGLITGPAVSHGGYYPSERPMVTWIQDGMIALGYAPNRPAWSDGRYGPPTVEAVAAWQHDMHRATTSLPGQFWHDDFLNLIRDWSNA